MTSARRFQLIPALVGAVMLSAAGSVAAFDIGSITILAVDPKTPTTVYAATCTLDGIRKSTDGGTTWIQAGLIGIPVFALVIDPQTSTTLYAVAGGRDCAGNWWGTTVAGVYMSTDGGITWSVAGLSGVGVNALAIDPLRPEVLYAAADWYGVLRSEDRGTTWETTGAGPWMSQSVALDPRNPDTIYAADAFVGDEGFIQYGAIFKSLNGGQTWASTSLAAGDFRRLAIDPEVQDTVYATGIWATDYDTSVKGVFKSIDAGDTWTTTADGPCCNIAINPQKPAELYSWDVSGLYETTDRAANWVRNIALYETLARYGMSPRIATVAVAPLGSASGVDDQGAIYVATDVGVLKSTDGGMSWNPTGLSQHSPLASVSLDVASVSGGVTLLGRVTLRTPAVTDLTLSLISSVSSAASVPVSVTVPAGAITATFVINTHPVSSSTWLTISATLEDANRWAALVVTAGATLSSVTLNPSTLVGGASSIGTVTFTMATPSTGAVALVSAEATLAVVPASVTVPAGATTATFTISTSVPGTTTGVTIFATYGGATKAAVLTVVASTLTSISLFPPSVSGGAFSTGTVMLSSPAPPQGAVIALLSSNTAAAVPSTVTVPGGATTANFTIATIRSCSSTTATISASYGGVTMASVITVNAGPTDAISIGRADYFRNRHLLRVSATGVISTATLRVFVTSSDTLIGTLTSDGRGTYSGEFDLQTNPQSITVRNSACGSATTSISVK